MMNNVIARINLHYENETSNRTLFPWKREMRSIHRDKFPSPQCLLKKLWVQPGTLRPTKHKSPSFHV